MAKWTENEETLLFNYLNDKDISTLTNEEKDYLQSNLGMRSIASIKAKYNKIKDDKRFIDLDSETEEESSEVLAIDNMNLNADDEEEEDVIDKISEDEIKVENIQEEVITNNDTNINPIENEIKLEEPTVEIENNITQDNNSEPNFTENIDSTTSKENIEDIINHKEETSACSKLKVFVKMIKDFIDKLFK